jgi:hypothetical protein
MSQFPIFKVNRLSDKNKTDTIYVFCGSTFSDEDLNDLFVENPNNKIFADIFDKNEITDIQKNDIEVVFIEQSIHIDDSIGIIKLKLFDAIRKTASMSEIYLYCLKSEKLNPITVYQNLTQNDKLPLTKVRLNQILLNLYDVDGDSMNIQLDDKPIYTFDDILKLDLLERDYLVAKPLGQKIVFANEYPFIADPFLVENYDTVLERSRRELTTLNANLLLETGPIFKNTIYLCLAKDVFSFVDVNDLQGEYVTKLYYPFLYQDKINTSEELDLNRGKLIEATSEKLTTNTERNFENIDMFYDVFRYRKPSSKFSENLRQTGIVSLKITIYPDFNIKIPIDVIFKLIHASQEFPLIKYNPETRQENIYRLFAPDITVDGRKIPYLQKASIFKLMRNIGKSKSVAVYTNIQYKGLSIYMACEFEENGNITVYPLVDFESPILLTNSSNIFSDIDAVIQLAVNPLIEQIKPFFEQSGLVIPLFQTIQSVNVEVRDLKYQTQYTITKAINITKFSGCISSAFIIESSNFKKGIQMRFKRVANFNKRDSQEAFIIEKIDQGLKIDDIIEELLQQYDDLDQESATDLIVKIRTELEVTRGANRRRSVAIKINPGFKTALHMNFITSELTIVVSGINDIYYLNTVPIYLDTMLRITQDIDSSEIKANVISKLCSGKELEDIEFGQITAQSEKPLEDNEVPIFVDDTPVYSQNEEEQGENMDELLDMLGFEEDEASDLEGGQNTSPSVQSDVLSVSTAENASPESLGNLSDLDFGEIEQLPDQSSPSIQEEQLSQSSPSIQEELVVEAEYPSQSLKSVQEEPIVEEEEIEFVPKKIKPAKGNPETKIPMQKKLKENAEQLENTVRDITGMKLKYPNPFSARLEERMPQLFVKSKDEKFDLYTRMCPFSLSDRRQPVILTKEEKDKIIAEHPGEVDENADFIEYGADAKDSSKKFYYTCPRYWCLLTNTLVTEQDILDGKCGPKVDKVEDAIIPKKAEEVPKGKYVYKFYDENERKYPGFHKQKTPSGLCIPCCYSNWSTTEMKNRRDICQGKFDEKTAQPVSETEKRVEEELRKETVEVEHYVKGPEKYGPQLGEHRWGFLPIVVQKFLQEVNEDCQISKTNMNLKPNHTCILRHGVEVSANQSFIACIASAIFYGQRDELSKKPLINRYIPNAKYDVPTIKEMKEIIIQAIDLDKFIKYQNGDLVTSFADISLEVNIDDYRESKIYKKINTSKKQQTVGTSETIREDRQFLERTIQAFENFKRFLREDRISIDYTYLWDLVCMPNPMLFATGINLIILEIPEDDATNNIDLVCPTNHYSAQTYDTHKRTLILIKRENYFEPIYGYRNDGKRINITKTFSEYDKKLPKTLRSVFSKIIKPTLGEKCRAFVSRPNEYRFKQAPILDTLIETILSKGYSVTVQVLNFQGKVIGILARNKEGLEGFIPCYPSALTSLKNKKKCDINSEHCEYEYVFMNDSIWKPYEQTLEFLKEYYDYEEPKDITMVNCFNPKYFCRVVEDELITGFLTNTNQFVPIKDPIPISSVDDNIKTIQMNNMLVADINTLTNSQVDSKRVDFIKRIQLETNFYNVFRNTIRILFNDYSNSEKRKKIQDECNRRFSLYKHQLDTVIELLHDLVNDNIVFASDGIEYKDIDESHINTCISNDVNKCGSEGSICRVTKDKCTLVLPRKNLVNDTDNELYYYGRMADELIRYNRIKSFIFKPQAYLSFGQVKYNLRGDEIIVLQDLLNQEFFENLVPAEINRFAKYNTYDTAEPIISQTYKKELNFDEIINPKVIQECKKTEPLPIKSTVWHKCFPTTYKEVEYSGASHCTLNMLIDIIKAVKNIDLTVDGLKDDLIEEYSKLTDRFTNEERIQKIIQILKEESQSDLTDIQIGPNFFEQLIIPDSFMAVNFDIWILLVRYRIPSIFISSKFIPETRYNFNEFVCYMDNNNDKQFVFIVTPAMYKRSNQKIPQYKIIQNNEQSLSINLGVLRGESCMDKIRTAIDHFVSIDDYLDLIFEKDVTTKYKPKQKGLREISFEIENEGEEPAEINKKPKKIKRIQPTLLLEEAEEVREENPNQEFNIEDIILAEPIDFTPTTTKKKRTKRKGIRVNPHGKKTTRKKLSETVEIIEEQVN